MDGKGSFVICKMKAVSLSQSVPCSKGAAEREVLISLWLPAVMYKCEKTWMSGSELRLIRRNLTQ